MEDKLARYYEVRHLISSADLIEWDTDSFIGWSIQSLTGMDVNHTSGVASMLLEGDDEKRIFIYEADEQGWHPAYLSTRLLNHKGKAYLLKLHDVYKRYRIPIMNSVLSYDGKPYDYKSLVWNAFRRQPLNRKKLYCSEGWQAALVDVGLINPDFSPTGLRKHKGCGLRPGEFYRTGLFQPRIRIL